MIGGSVLRKEDERFLTGQGRYLADHHDSNTQHIALLRSQLAHARILSIDVGPALASPGVIAAFTGADLATVSEPFDHLLSPARAKPLKWPLLATGKVRFVGEPLAAVVARSRALAEDALALIEMELEQLDAVVDVDSALARDAPLLYDEWDSNVFVRDAFEYGDPDAAAARAEHVLRARLVNHRVAGVPLEGRGAIGEFDSATGQLTLWSSQQQPHQLRTVVSEVARLSEKDVRVIAPDIGGGFGNKQHFHREEALVAVLAVQTGQRVSWIEDRVESLTASVHSRDTVGELEVAFDGAGKIAALSARLTTDLGNPVLYFTGAGPTLTCARVLTGAYAIDNYGCELLGVATNKCPVGAYRGFGRPEALFMVERMMDLIADHLQLDPAEVRRRNLIPEKPRPYISAGGTRFDPGPLEPLLDRALAESSYDSWRQRQADLRREGRHIGIGVVSNLEGGAPNLHGVAGRFGAFEMAITTVTPDGHVTVAVGTKSTGQGHETALAQVAASEFTLPVGRVRVLDGDTRLLPYGMGTWGSRSAIMGGGAVTKASRRVRDKMARIAAHLMSVVPEDVRLEGGVFRAGGRELEFRSVAEAAYLHPHVLPQDEEVGLTCVCSYDPRLTNALPDAEGRGNGCMTYSGCAAVAVVEVDVTTGRTEILDVVIVHDPGRVINPMILVGQVQGGFAQGVGVTLLEEMVYGDDGQPLASTLLDYQVPCFGDAPRVRLFHESTEPDLVGPFRGAGELGIILAPALLAGAIDDAVKPFGVEIRQTNLGAQRLRAMLRDAGVPFDPLAEATQSPVGTHS